MAFFPADQLVPQTLRTSTFLLRQLREAEAALDYEAYMASPDVIRIHSGGRWPVHEFTLAQEQQELALHEVRHDDKRDFAFILITPDEAQALGCVYVLPLAPLLRHFAAPAALLSQVSDATALITFWVRQDRQQTLLAREVVAAVHDWLLTEWPFDDHLFRVNHEEHASLQALEQCGFHVRFELTMDEPPYHYLFFGKATS
jgi:RimJ/RimL family protein N-acetyltransferase